MIVCRNIMIFRRRLFRGTFSGNVARVVSPSGDQARPLINGQLSAQLSQWLSDAGASGNGIFIQKIARRVNVTRRRDVASSRHPVRRNSIFLSPRRNTPVERLSGLAISPSPPPRTRAPIRRRSNVFGERISLSSPSSSLVRAGTIYLQAFL